MNENRNKVYLFGILDWYRLCCITPEINKLETICRRAIITIHTHISDIDIVEPKASNCRDSKKKYLYTPPIKQKSSRNAMKWDTIHVKQSNIKAHVEKEMKRRNLYTSMQEDLARSKLGGKREI